MTRGSLPPSASYTSDPASGMDRDMTQEQNGEPAGEQRRDEEPLAGRSARKRGPKAAPPKVVALKPARLSSFAPDESDRHLLNYRQASGDVSSDGHFRVTRSLVVAARLWRKVANERIKPLNQTMARWETLFHVAYSEAELTQGELARLINVEGSSMVRMLDSLARDGLIEREQSALDRRVTVNRITPAGELAIQEIMAITNDLRGEMLDEIDPEKLAVAYEVLSLILKRLVQMR
ncbi:MAG TPA: MarR family transcriptional regulator [Novosphingobium sp.]|nr:MarR family transcriptional regulator [Novosphingobium sp.]